MATVTFASLLPKVLPSVPGAPQPLVVQHLRDAAIRACETSLLWRYTPPPFVLQPGSHENLFRKPQDTAVHVIFAATCNDRPLTKATLEEAICMYPEWADRFNGLTGDELWQLTAPETLNAEEFNELLFAGSDSIIIPPEAYDGGSEPRYITQLTPEKYVVLPLPGADEVYTLRMFYALKPSKTASGMDEAILSELEDVVIHGALQQLLVMPKVTWNDNTLAAYHARQFLFRLTERRARANLNNNRSSLTARGGSFS
jgi:hypothetical protein